LRIIAFENLKRSIQFKNCACPSSYCTTAWRKRVKRSTIL